MNRRAAVLVVGGAAVLAAAALIWWVTAGRRASVAPAAGVPATGGGGEATLGELYFPNTAGWLETERRELPASAPPEERARRVVAELLAGPEQPGHLAPLGEGVELAALHLSDAGVVYVDLAAAQLTAPPVGGSRNELLAVYSFVNSILANVPEASGVVLLWNGNQRPTFAGHVDTTRPLPAESMWVARRAG